jgi:NADPH2:quinone reductase
MRALVIHQFTDPTQLKLEEVPTPQPRTGEVLIAIKGASINPSDVKNVAGKMHGTLLPRIPGRDFAGVVVQQGDNATDLLGKEVWGTGGDISRTRDGSHAEFLLLPRTAVTLKPAALAMEAAAVSGLSFITAWQALVTVAQVAPGETVVIFGANGGVGSPSVQIAKSRGARVIGVVRSDADIPSVRADGADEAINSQSTNPVEAILALTNNRGANVAFDASGMMFNEAVEAAAPDARLPIVAASPDGKATFNLRTLYRKMLRVHGIDTLRLDATACAQLLTQLSPAFNSGQLKARPGKPIPLSNFAAAYEQSTHGGPRLFLQPQS